MLDSLFQDQFESLQALLKVVGLESLERRAGGMHAEVTWDWYTVLSQGELQRLAFARLFYHNPRYAGTSVFGILSHALAVLDEATSALGMDDELHLYGEAVKRGMTLISVGHRDSLFQVQLLCVSLKLTLTPVPQAQFTLIRL